MAQTADRLLLTLGLGVGKLREEFDLVVSPHSVQERLPLWIGQGTRRRDAGRWLEAHPTTEYAIADDRIEGWLTTFP